MTSVTAENLKSTWEAIFLRKGGNGTYTCLFDSLEPDKRDVLLSEFKLGEGELPVIGGVQDKNNWLLLTTKRLAWSKSGQRDELGAENIRDATADFERLRHQESKLDMNELQVLTTAGRKYPIELEPGLPLSGIWNVLKHIGARNRGSAH